MKKALAVVLTVLFLGVVFCFAGSVMAEDTCYGILQSDPDVCSGKGFCGDQDDCVCFTGWSGSDCSECVPGGDADPDGDGICGDMDPCPYDPENDVDGDWFCGDVDNCPDVFNPDQVDVDGDGSGKACDECPNDPNRTDPCGVIIEDVDFIGDNRPDSFKLLVILFVKSAAESVKVEYSVDGSDYIEMDDTGGWGGYWGYEARVTDDFINKLPEYFNGKEFTFKATDNDGTNTQTSTPYGISPVPQIYDFELINSGPYPEISWKHDSTDPPMDYYVVRVINPAGDLLWGTGTTGNPPHPPYSPEASFNFDGKYQFDPGVEYFFRIEARDFFDNYKQPNNFTNAVWNRYRLHHYYKYSPPITIEEPFHFRANRSENTLGWTTGDYLVIGAEKVAPVEGTTVEANQGGNDIYSLPLLGDNPDYGFLDYKIQYDENKTGAWTLTAINGPYDFEIDTPDRTGVQLMPFVENVRFIVEDQKWVVKWDVPEEAFANRVRLQIFDDETDTRIYKAPKASIDTTSHTLPLDKLDYFHPYVLRIMIAETENGEVNDPAPAIISRSELFVNFILTGIPATIDIKPDNLNAKSKGKYITCYIELPEDLFVENIDIDTVRLENSIPAKARPTKIGDYDQDGIPDLMVKFKRRNVIKALGKVKRGDVIELQLTGELIDGKSIIGSDVITIVKKGDIDDASDSDSDSEKKGKKKKKKK